MPATAEVKTGAEQSAADAKDAQDGIALFRSFLLAFAGIALFVGALVIFNTHSITVAQRTRELATLSRSSRRCSDTARSRSHR